MTVESIPDQFKALHQCLTAHGLLASFLAFGGLDASFYEPWKATWPSFQNFEETMPILWPSSVRRQIETDIASPFVAGLNEQPAHLLPRAIGGNWADSRGRKSRTSRDEGILYRQEQKLKADWDIVSKRFPGGRKRRDFFYYWLVVNTRSFYFESSDVPLPPKDDRMVLCPFVDYFNHGNHGCKVAFNKQGYTVTSDRRYDVGEEIYTCYGGHSNDLLLVEYGFILDNNRYDCIPLDDFFCRYQLNKKIKKSLERAGYLGDYSLNGDGVCFRTQVAIQRELLGTCSWRKFIAGENVGDENIRANAHDLLGRTVFLPLEKQIQEVILYMENIGNTIPSGPKDLVSRRWLQMRELLYKASDVPAL